MLKRVAEGVWSHQSAFMESNAVIVQGLDGMLLIDAGVQDEEMVCLANDLSELGQTVVAGFSTHPHWDHLLWHPKFGMAPRYATERCAATVRERLSDDGARARVAQMIPADIVERVPLDLLGQVSGLPEKSAFIPWDGPQVRVIEHQAHAPGHAALVIEQCGVLVAGDMLSDILVPMLNHMTPGDPIEDYLAALELFDGVADHVDYVVPGHGSVGTSDQVRARIDRDRAYVRGIQNDNVPADSRIAP